MILPQRQQLASGPSVFVRARPFLSVSRAHCGFWRAFFLSLRRNPAAAPCVSSKDFAFVERTRARGEGRVGKSRRTTARCPPGTRREANCPPFRQISPSFRQNSVFFKLDPPVLHSNRLRHFRGRPSVTFSNHRAFFEKGWGPGGRGKLFFT